MIPNEQRERMIRSSATENERFLLGLLDEARGKLAAHEDPYRVQPASGSMRPMRNPYRQQES